MTALLNMTKSIDAQGWRRGRNGAVLGIVNEGKRNRPWPADRQADEKTGREKEREGKKGGGGGGKLDDSKHSKHAEIRQYALVETFYQHLVRAIHSNTNTITCQ